MYQYLLYINLFITVLLKGSKKIVTHLTKKIHSKYTQIPTNQK